VKEVIEALEPKMVWKHFYALNQIPRCSKEEEQVSEYVKEFAEKCGLTWKADKVGNLLISKPATKGMEKRPALVIQGHLDMVCEKNNDTEHDFSKDPIKMIEEDGWVTADGTTLGADNGIAVAMGMAVMEAKNIPHPPMEFLFTIDEETGLTGANALKSDFVDGRILLNIDSEEEGALYIGCAGGLNTFLTKNIEWQKASNDFITYKLKVGGLRGGHSGLNIHEGFGNAIILSGRLLKALSCEINMRMVAVNAGSKHNAIPREAESVIQIMPDQLVKAKEIIGEYQQIFRDEFKAIEKDIFISLEETGRMLRVFSDEFTSKLIRLMYAVTNGVMAMSRTIDGLVETSTNMAIIETKEKTVELLTSQRSSMASAVKDTAGKVKAIAELAGFRVDYNDGYPAWEPNPDSKLLGTCKKIYADKYGSEPAVKAIHAGLECGIIGEKYDGMDMISFGPDIEGAHSPDEKIHIKSTEHIWEYLLEILKTIQ